MGFMFIRGRGISSKLYKLCTRVMQRGIKRRYRVEFFERVRGREERIMVRTVATTSSQSEAEITRIFLKIKSLFFRLYHLLCVRWKLETPSPVKVQ